MRTIITPKFETLRTRIEALPGHFGEGELLYSGRNEIRKFSWDGRAVVAKRFRRLGLLRKIVYTFFRDNKALRSYRNAKEIIRRGFSTPEPVAYVETRRCGLIEDLYYLTAETSERNIKSELIDKEPYNAGLLNDYARFVASLHEHGILHRDLNPTNVLFGKTQQGGYCFMLIDINRMEFFDGPVPKRKCMENLTLFWWLSPVYRAVLNVYATERRWTPADIDAAIRVKEAHDRRWVRRKRLLHPLRNRTLKLRAS